MTTAITKIIGLTLTGIMIYNKLFKNVRPEQIAKFFCDHANIINTILG